MSSTTTDPAGWLPAAPNAIVRYRNVDELGDEPAVPATPFDELVVEHSANVYGEGYRDPDEAARAWRLDRTARYLLVEINAGAYLLSSHDTIRAATEQADTGEGDWHAEALHDLTTGRTYEGVRTTVFHRTDNRHPDAGQPFVTGPPDALVNHPPRTGYVVGYCGHAVAGSEWRAGFRVCERDDPAAYGPVDDETADLV